MPNQPKDTVKSLAGRLGAHRLHASHDSRAIAARAREGLEARFRKQAEREANERGESLSEVELDRRAEHVRKAYYVELALASARARRKKRG